MSDIEELVDLPDPAVQPLVHPIDVDQARGLFRRGWIVASVTGPAVALCVAALVWFASRNVIAPVAAGASLVGFGALASRYYLDEAWAFVPRRRQDRDRVLPLAWELAAPSLFALLLAAVLLLTVNRLGQADVPVDVRRFTFGMAVAAAAVIVLDLVGKVVMGRGGQRRRALYAVPGVVAVVAAVVVAVAMWFEGADPAWTALTVAGAVTMLVIGGVAGLVRSLEARGRRETDAAS